MSMTTKESLVSLLKTANISGPFIDAGHVTAKPTKKFLQGIRDPRLRYLEVPRNLLWAFGDRDDGGEVDPLAFYLCVALARHFSYFKMYGVLYHTNILNSSGITLYDLYKDFRVSFGVTCGVLKDMAENDNMSPTDVTFGVEELKQLIELEKLVTRQTFDLLPVLFVKTMATDAKLLETLTGISTKDRIRRASDPKDLLETVQTRLKNEWIPLGDAEDVLDRSWEIYHNWQYLKKAKGELEEHCCNLQKAFAGSQEYAIAAEGFPSDEAVGDEMEYEEPSFHELEEDNAQPVAAAERIEAKEVEIVTTCILPGQVSVRLIWQACLTSLALY